MPQSQRTAYKVHDALAGRIDALLVARGLTFSEWMLQETEAAIQAGEINAALPGFRAIPLPADHPDVTAGPAVRLEFGDARLPNMTPAHARTIANMIHGLTLTRGRDAAQGIQVAPDINLTMFRKGKGLIFAVSVTGHDSATVSTLPLTMGFDLAKIVNRAANDAQGLTAEQANDLAILGA